MYWILRLLFSAFVYQGLSAQIPENWGWAQLVVPMVASAVVLYLQIIGKIVISSIPQLLWLGIKVILVKTLISLPFAFLPEASPEVNNFASNLGWILALLTVLLPSSSRLSPLSWVGRLLGKLFGRNPFKANLDLDMESVDKLGNNGRDFEAYVASLYRAFGFEAYTTTELRETRNLPKTVLLRGGSGEQGVDVVVYFPQPRVINNQLYDGLLVQCKQYSSTVGNKAIQEIFSAIPMYAQHFKRRFKPVVVTNNYFTKQAKDLAATNDVQLCDREILASLIKDSANVSREGDGAYAA